MKDFRFDDPKTCGDMILRPLVLGGVITKVYEYDDEHPFSVA